MITATTKSVDDTRALAGEVAPLVRPGDLLLLAGELGAGKTAFVQGLGRALGVEEPITSPAFVLVRAYDGRLPLVHADAYRLDHLQELVDLGLSEIADDEGVTVVEWGDVVAPVLPADFLEARLEHGAAADERRLMFRSVGPSWAPRMTALRRAVGRWTADP